MKEPQATSHKSQVTNSCKALQYIYSMTEWLAETQTTALTALLHYCTQLNSTQLNSTQLNSTRPNNIISLYRPTVRRMQRHGRTEMGLKRSYLNFDQNEYGPYLYDI